MEQINILVVEDNFALRKLMGRLLDKQGYRVVPTACPKESLKALDGVQSWNLVIMDVNLPEMSSRELFAAIRRSHPQLKVLLTSGEKKEEEIGDLLREPGVEFLLKPYNNNEFLGTVRRLATNG